MTRLRSADLSPSNPSILLHPMRCTADAETAKGLKQIPEWDLLVTRPPYWEGRERGDVVAHGISQTATWQQDHTTSNSGRLWL